MLKQVNLSICLNGYTKKSGANRLYLRTQITGYKPKFYDTGICVSADQWDKATHNVIAHDNADVINATLQRQLLDLQKYALHVQNRCDGRITPAHIQAYFDYGAHDFISFLEKEMENQKKRKITTCSHEKVTLGYLKEYAPSLLFSDLTVDFLTEWNGFLLSQNLKISTIQGHHKRLKKYINIAIRKDIIQEVDNPYKKYKVVRPQQSQRTTLLQKEIAKIENYVPETETAGLVRDIFLFSCYTGLRNGDVLKLALENFQDSEEGVDLVLVAGKTQKPLRLPLHKLFDGKPLAIIQPYIDKQPAKNLKVPFFGEISQLTVNRTLKKIAADLNIRKYLTTHVARHTFATYMADKIPIFVLKDILQHSDINTTTIYVHMANTQLNNALDKIEKW